MTKKINSREKGKRGELEASATLRRYGFDARRGQQFSGGSESPDVVSRALDAFHLEIKRVEAGNLYNWLAQAVRDAGPSKVPCVLHRRSRQEWVVIMRLEDFLTQIVVKDL